MTETSWPSAQDIINANGQVIQNPDGTISVYTFNSITGQLAPQRLVKSSCDALGISGAYFDSTAQKCRWSAINCDAPFNLVINSRGSDGTIFSVYPDQTCTLSVDFDYLFKFDCATLTQLAAGTITGTCNTIIDVFENIGASVVIDVAPTSTSLTRVFEQTMFAPIGTGNLYNYLSFTGANSGFYVTGTLANNPSDTNYYPLNLYDLLLSGYTLDCGAVTNQIIDGLYKESGLAITDLTAFTENINANSFGGNWAHFHTEITDPVVISAITNQKIKLSIKVSGTCVDTCVLLDNIQLNQNCTKVDKNEIFVTHSPGFTFDKVRDNKKSWVANDVYTERAFSIKKTDGTNPIRYTDYYLNNEQQVVNTKEINLDLDLASAVETDVWNYISNNPCILTGVSVGTTTCSKLVYDITLSACTTKTYCCSEYCGDANIDINGLMTQPLSAVTTVEDFEYFLTSELIDVKNRKTITSYPTLKLLYDRYVNNLQCSGQSNGFNYYLMDTFSNMIGNYWVDIVEQVIPATTIWGSTKIYTNTIFDYQKFQYKSYSTQFGFNGNSFPKVLSPATGVSCNASATTKVIQGYTTETAQFFNAGQIQNYNNIYVIQMNSGSEFIGNVSFLGGVAGNNVINECTIEVIIDVVEPSYNQSNGSATANVYGSTGPVTYKWNTGAQTQTISNLPTGIYSVTVTDTNRPECTAFAEVYIINQPCNLSLTGSSTLDYGNLSNGTATVSASGGQPPYVYEWSTIPIQTGQTATGLTSGSYIATVTDTVLCQNNITINVGLVPCSVVANVNVLNASNGLTNGSVTAVATGGVAPFKYLWNTSYTGQTINGLSGGTYSVTITDAYNCTSSASGTVYNIPCNLSAITSSISATGNTADGSATVTAINGSAPYTYHWYTSPVQTGQTATGLSGGTYNVTVYDASGCNFTTSATVSTVACTLSGLVNSQVVYNTATTKTLTLTPINGFAPYTYSWNTIPVQTSQTATGLTAGTYIGTITDSYNCAISLTGHVYLSACTLSAITASTNTINNYPIGTASVTGTSGTLPYTYSWNTIPVQTGQTATGLTAGTYAVTITDSNGCSITDNIKVNNTPCSLSASTSQTSNSATAYPSGGYAPYTYHWNTTPVQTGQTATGLTAGTYTVTITDAYNCTAQTSVTIVTIVNVYWSIPTSITPPTASLYGNFGGAGWNLIKTTTIGIGGYAIVSGITGLGISESVSLYVKDTESIPQNVEFEATATGPTTYCGVSDPYTFNVTGSTNVYLNLLLNGGGTALLTC
jgi:SprB repeat